MAHFNQDDVEVWSEMIKCKVIKNCRILYEGEFQNVSAGTILEVDEEFFENLEQCGLVERAI